MRWKEIERLANELDKEVENVREVDNSPYQQPEKKRRKKLADTLKEMGLEDQVLHAILERTSVAPVLAG